MTRTLSALAILAALAGPAAAQELHVNVAGLDQAAARQEIRRAVQEVCSQADRQGAFQGTYSIQNCLMDGEARGMAEYRAYQAVKKGQPTALASAVPASPTDQSR
jgi:predicted phosphoribosyltransferase